MNGPCWEYQRPPGAERTDPASELGDYVPCTSPDPSWSSDTHSGYVCADEAGNLATDDGYGTGFF